MILILNLRWWASKGKWPKGCNDVGPTCEKAAIALSEAKAIMETFAPRAGNHTICTPGAFQPMADWLKRWG